MDLEWYFQQAIRQPVDIEMETEADDIPALVNPPNDRQYKVCGLDGATLYEGVVRTPPPDSSSLDGPLTRKGSADSNDHTYNLVPLDDIPTLDPAPASKTAGAPEQTQEHPASTGPDNDDDTFERKWAAVSDNDSSDDSDDDEAERLQRSTSREAKQPSHRTASRAKKVPTIVVVEQDKWGPLTRSSNKRGSEQPAREANKEATEAQGKKILKRLHLQPKAEPTVAVDEGKGEDKLVDGLLEGLGWLNRLNAGRGAGTFGAGARARAMGTGPWASFASMGEDMRRFV